jgi:hypothetical protein
MLSKCLVISIVVSAASVCSSAQTPSAAPTILARHYQEGEKLTYHMKGSNRGRTGTMLYEADAAGVVKKNAAGKFVEEYAWSNLVVNGAPVALSPAAAAFRQQLSLDEFLGVPDLSQVVPLIGPITDTLTFYVDLLLATRQGSLTKPGDHFVFKSGTANSWADGNYVITGEDSINFDITLAAVDPAAKVATVVVRHVVPAEPHIKISADWMKPPVADTPNNWTEIHRNFASQSDADKYVAAIGKETFDVELKVSLVDGKIISGKIDNPVEVLERNCSDLTLTVCGAPARYQILRQIELH